MNEEKVEIVKSVPLYLCDPKKNTKCKKTLCGNRCYMTQNEEFSIYGTPFLYAYITKIVKKGNE